MNIGIVTVWFECGAGYVSKSYKTVLESLGHRVHVFARGGYYPTQDPLYALPEVHFAKKVDIPITYAFCLDEFRLWIEENKLDCVFFNEQTWFPPVLLCKKLKIKTGSYIDYYTKDIIKCFELYDFLICNTIRHYSVFKWHKQCFYVPWGTDIETYRPMNRMDDGRVVFFHSCGPTPERKGTDLVLKAFLKMPDRAKLVIHSQGAVAHRMPRIKNYLKEAIKTGRCEVIEKTVGAPGLYHLGDVYVYPTRLEGIGLTICEALACGLPVITTDEAPMNEFISERNGSLVRIRSRWRRSDNYYWDMVEVDEDDLVDKMKSYVDKYDRSKIKKQIRNNAVKRFNWSDRKQMLGGIFKDSVFIDIDDDSNFVEECSSLKVKSSGWRYRIYKSSPSVYSTLFKLWTKIKDIRQRKMFGDAGNSF